MADPTLQTFCCVRNSSTRIGADEMLQFRSGPYNVLCIVSSILGILGATYQILPRDNLPVSRKPSSSYLRSRYIIVWLATADLLASLAVLIRSVSWITGKSIAPTNAFIMGYTFDTLFCAISSGWIQYFYTVTCLWTLCYALDVFKVVHGQKGAPKMYHFVSWGVPAALSVVGLTILYYPNIDCHEMGSNAFARILPNYFFTYLPIMLVMIVNPILYFMSAKRAEEIIMSSAGRYTHSERKQLRTLRIKFLCINLVFYLCWLPNLLNAFLLWTMWTDLPKGFLLFDWHLMAIVNPLQAMLNALVYRKWGDHNNNPVRFPWVRITSKELHSETSFLIEPENRDYSSHSGSSSDDSKTLSINGYGSL